MEKTEPVQQTDELSIDPNNKTVVSKKKSEDKAQDGPKTDNTLLGKRDHTQKRYYHQKYFCNN